MGKKLVCDIGWKLLTRGEDVNTLAVVRKVIPFITHSGSTNGDGLLGSCRGVRASIPVVVPSGDSEVHARVDGPVDRVVQCLRHTPTQRHVGDRTLVLRLPGGSVFSLCSRELLSSLVSSAQDGLAPGGMTLELGMFGVDAGIDDMHVNALTTGRVVLVESKSSETEFITVGDTSKTLEHSKITNHATKAGLRNIPME